MPISMEIIVYISEISRELEISLLELMIISGLLQIKKFPLLEKKR